MSAWSDEEFQRVALSTKMAKRTLDACKEVLVNGRDGKDVADEKGMLPGQISRGIKLLRETQVEMVESVKKMRRSTESLRSYAIDSARALVRGNWGVKDAEPGNRYEGVCIMQTPGFMVQQVDRDLVVHDLGKIDTALVMMKELAIDYPADGGMARVEPVVRRMNQRAQDRGGVGR